MLRIPAIIAIPRTMDTCTMGTSPSCSPMKCFMPDIFRRTRSYLHAPIMKNAIPDDWNTREITLSNLRRFLKSNQFSFCVSYQSASAKRYERTTSTPYPTPNIFSDVRILCVNLMHFRYIYNDWYQAKKVRSFASRVSDAHPIIKCHKIKYYYLLQR